jgi:hypothetical protein
MLRSNGEVARPREVEQLVAVQYALRPFNERDQQVELGRPQIDERTSRRIQPPAGDLEAPAKELEYLAGAGWRARQRYDGASQDRADASEQLARAKGLRDIIVGAHLEADDAVGLFSDRGQHDDGEATAGPRLAAEREAIPAGQQDVEDDQIDPGVGQDLHHRVAIGRDRDAIAVPPEEFRE